QAEKVFLLVQTGGIEEEERNKARYGVQMIFPSLAANGTVYLRSRNEGYYDESGSVSATGQWGGWKKIVTLDQMPQATAATAGLVKVGDGLKMTSGALGVDPNGCLSLLNLGVTGTKLAVNADLNELGNGVWRCDTSDLAASIAHLPPLATTDLRAFTVLEYGSVVISSAESRYGVQLFMTNPSPANGTAEIFLRNRGYTGGWRPWQRAGETPSLSLMGTAVAKQLLPNVQYECADPVASLTLTFRAANLGTQPEYAVMFTAGANMTLSVPDVSVSWVGKTPVWVAGNSYLVTFVPMGSGYLGLWGTTV
ncbi:MAG: hypothetical protein IJK98_12515, partial [Clostridia bacterium]|nr:hypothetical protein [Clostridia bacterium]